jgi:UDP-2,3-diacylglucosamine hydrolase
VPDYFLSDVHLRHDRPERGLRLARLVDRLGPADRLFIVGDLCDFWLASRQRRADPMTCTGLRALVDFRVRGGEITAFAGNHDAWLGAFYRSLFEPMWVDDDLRVESHGLRLHLVHGHRLGARSPWKATMESRAFLRGFAAIPERLALALENRLERSNDAHREAVDLRHLSVYRRHAHAMAGSVDLAIVGHIHRVVDDPGPPRMVVLGGWHRRASYLRIDDRGASFVVEPDPSAGAASARRAASSRAGSP